MKVTMFKGLWHTKPTEFIDMSEIIQMIKSDKWKQKIEDCRKNLKKKDYLPCFTPTGIFNHRSIAGMEQYNGVICLDIDNLEDPETLKEKCSKLPYVMCAFVTPSSKGLKVIIVTNGKRENYREVEEFVAQKFLEDTGAKRDNGCKDIARIQFISHDPLLFFNDNSAILEIPILVTTEEDKQLEMF